MFIKYEAKVASGLRSVYRSRRVVNLERSCIHYEEQRTKNRALRNAIE